MIFNCCVTVTIHFCITWLRWRVVRESGSQLIEVSLKAEMGGDEMGGHG